jgi:hypothetical protein
MKTKVNKAHLMTGYSKNRIDNDVYNTPTRAIKELLSREEFKSDVIWECACGKGNISKELESYYGYDKDILSSDLRDDDEIYGLKNSNFLKCSINDIHSIGLILGFSEFKTFDVITNPPFSHALEFILHAKELGASKIAMLLKLDFLGSIKRFDTLWADKTFPLTKMYVFVKRLDFGLKATPTLCHAWYIFENGSNKTKPEIEWITNHVN